MKRMWSVNTREYYSAMTKDILPFVPIQMDLEGLTRRQTEKDKYCMISLMHGM